MISVKTGIRAEEVRFQAQHVLFVEGRGKNSVDPNVLDGLLNRSIRIEPLGPSFSIQSAAQALFSFPPTYYFLIDRDHYDNNFAEQCWGIFQIPKLIAFWSGGDVKLKTTFLNQNICSSQNFVAPVKGNWNRRFYTSPTRDCFLMWLIMWCCQFGKASNKTGLRYFPIRQTFQAGRRPFSN